MSLIRTTPGARPRRPDRPEAPAPRQLAAYRCDRGHDFSITFYAGVVVPDAWDCRCGAGGHLSGSEPASPADSGQE